MLYLSPCQGETDTGRDGVKARHIRIETVRVRGRHRQRQCESEIDTDIDSVMAGQTRVEIL